VTTQSEAPSRRVERRRPVAGILAAATGVLLWGVLLVTTRWVEEVNGLALGFHRLWVGAVGATIALLIAGGRPTRRTLRIALPGGILFGADIGLFFSALKLTTVANATIVAALQPAALLFVGRSRFGERVSPVLIGITFAGIAGAALVVVGSSGSDEWSPLGDFLAVLALVSWSGYFVASKQAREQLSSLEYLSAFLLIATVTLAPIALLFGGRLRLESADSWAWVITFALFSGGMGHWLMNWAHAHVPLYLTSLLTLSIPVVSTATAALLLGEDIVLLQVVGMAVVVVALGFVIFQTETGGDDRVEGVAIEA
jgi:drug/metabolite transporter (DMT)-like permease